MVTNKIDSYHHRERYLHWKEESEKGIEGLSPQNEKILKNYLSDMENGLNVAFLMKKGPRSYTRLHTLRIRIRFLMHLFQERENLNDLTRVSEEQLHKVFREIRTGIIRKNDGSQYQSAKDYARDFKAFWHWHQKVNRKKGVDIKEITEDLDTTGEKPKWVYLTEAEVKKLADMAKYEYRVLIWFLFDAGIRAPTELMNIRVADFHNDYKELNIRQEISKTFGRRIKLMLCSDIIKEYIKTKGLKAEDYLFKISPPVTNRYLKRLAKRVLGDAESPARQKYSELTMYDFRHCSSCYWLPRYKSESALKYRFGWKKSDKIHYYSELLGMRDTIAEEDMLMDVTKTEIEKELSSTKKENEILQDRLRAVEFQITQISHLTNKLFG
jgi:hypothetical protein